MADIKVLIVVDGLFSLQNVYPDPTQPDHFFTISHLVATLRASTTPTFSVDTANRGFNWYYNTNLNNQADPNATIANPNPFLFDDPHVDLSVYDEIWLIGYEGTNFQAVSPPALSFISDSELAAITRFMDGGGGVFATGDHDGLGSLMCGRIPRVRSMRKWFASQDTDPRIPAQPPRNWPGGTADRADTLFRGTNPNPPDPFFFDYQSDDTPQPLSFPGNIVHAIMGGPNGPISGFPDHMHEGEVVVPTDLSRTSANDANLAFADPGFVEFPSVGSHQEIPSIIATGNITGGHGTLVSDGMPCENANFSKAAEQTASNKPPLNILAVYDGRAVGVGRVVTDSSFHHYMDLNLLGDPCSNPGTAMQQGFNFSASGKAALAEIEAFYINTATWLTRPDRNFYFAVDKNTFGVDEAVDNNTFPQFPNSFWLVVNGFSLDQVNSSISSNLLNLAGPFNAIGGIILTRGTPEPELPGSPGQQQRVLIPYTVQFSAASMSAFPNAGSPAIQKLLEATLSIAGTNHAAETSFELGSGADPCFRNVNPNENNAFYLSQDLRVFTANPILSPSPVPGAPPLTTSNPTGQDPGAASQFILNLLNYLNSHSEFTNPGNADPFASFPSDLTASGDSSVIPRSSIFTNYNFAVARVRLSGSMGSLANNVKVFFRLFLTQSNDTDYQPATTYLSTLDARGLPDQPLPPPDGETIPFFAGASSAIDYAVGGPNNHTITVSSSAGTSAYFGCFLNVYDPSVSNQLKGTHHCLVAQIAYDDAPIVNSNGLTLSPDNSDKLAQRNLQITPSSNPGGPASHRIPQTFDLRPSPTIRKTTGELLDYPDELMIDWGNTPLDSTAATPEASCRRRSALFPWVA